MYSRDVNYEPWSVLKISGRASSTMPRPRLQANRPSSVLDIRTRARTYFTSRSPLSDTVLRGLDGRLEIVARSVEIQEFALSTDAQLGIV